MAQRILVACELDQGATQRERLLPLVEGLTGRGHSVTLAVSDPDAWLPRQAVLAPSWRVSPPPGFLASTFADILLHAGYATPEALLGLLSAWMILLTHAQPDLLIADFAPTAMLAARAAGLAVAAIGDGYTLPPQSEPLPVMRTWAPVSAARVAETEGRVLAVVNACLGRLGRPSLAALADLSDADVRFLCTFAELDHYPDRGPAEYYGPIFGRGEGSPPDWPSGSAERLFIQLDGRRPMLGPLIEALDELGLPTIIQANHLAPQVVASRSRQHVRVVANAVDRSAALASCDIVACQDSAMVAPALLAGRPLLLLPLHVEQMMTVHRIAPQGLGHGIPPDANAPAINAALRRLLDDAACRQRAAAFAAAYFPYQVSLATEAIIGELMPPTEGIPPSLPAARP